MIDTCKKLLEGFYKLIPVLVASGGNLEKAYRAYLLRIPHVEEGLWHISGNLLNVGNWRHLPCNYKWWVLCHVLRL